MSWKYGEGPYGKYPNEKGYEEDLERYYMVQFERQMNDEYENNKLMVVREINLLFCCKKIFFQ